METSASRTHESAGGDGWMQHVDVEGDAAPEPPYRRSLFSILTTVLSVCVLFAISVNLLLSGPVRPASPLSTPGNHNSNRLTMGQNATVLRIAIFSDLHFGERDRGLEKDRDSAMLMDKILRQESPDMAVLNGDLVAGEDVQEESAESHILEALRPMADAKVPWASTYGNHDSQFNLSREMIYQTERLAYPTLSMTRQMGPTGSGITNYYVLVDKTGTGPVMVLWFFDSRGGAEYRRTASEKPQAEIDDWVADAAANWFRETSEELSARFGNLPSLAFVHIPPHVFRIVAANELQAALLPGLDADKRPLPVQGDGNKDNAFVAALGEHRGLHSVHSGHDHGSSWCAPWPEAENKRSRRHTGGGEEDKDSDRVAESKRWPPILCFSRRTGYGGYGNWDRGARILEIKLPEGANEDKLLVDTWIRLGNGSVMTHVSLNETYGIDRYQQY